MVPYYAFQSEINMTFVPWCPWFNRTTVRSLSSHSSRWCGRETLLLGGHCQGQPWWQVIDDFFLHDWHGCAAIKLPLLEEEFWVRQVKIALKVEPSDSVTNIVLNYVLNSPWDICHLTFVKIYDLGVWTAQYRVVDNRFFEYSFETVAPIALVLGTDLVAVTDWWSHASIYERTDMFTDTIFVQHYSLWMRIDAIPCQQNLHWS